MNRKDYISSLEKIGCLQTGINTNISSQQVNYLFNIPVGSDIRGCYLHLFIYRDKFQLNIDSIISFQIKYTHFPYL